MRLPNDVTSVHRARSELAGLVPFLEVGGPKGDEVGAAMSNASSVEVTSAAADLNAGKSFIGMLVREGRA